MLTRRRFVQVAAAVAVAPVPALAAPSPVNRGLPALFRQELLGHSDDPRIPDAAEPWSASDADPLADILAAVRRIQNSSAFPPPSVVYLSPAHADHLKQLRA